MQLFQRQHWIFDLDGTLTKPVHDFAKIRSELGLASGMGTIEALQLVPEPRRAELHRRLDQIGWDYALQSQIQDHARACLDALSARGCKLGVVTRNNRRNLDESLRLIDCEQHFPAEVRVSRDEPPAKPAPDGLLRLLKAWNAEPSDAVMVGDAIYDLAAGKAAKAATLYIDPDGLWPHREQADYCFRIWSEVLPHL